MTGLPEHVAIIMDGNGRWASARGLPRPAGHQAGVRSIRAVVTRCRELGVRFLSLYAFSNENWGRPPAEVTALMSLLRLFLRAERQNLIKNEIEVRAIGDRNRLPKPVRELLRETSALTRGLDGMRLTLALSYGGRDEMTRAVRRIAEEVAAGRLLPAAITCDVVSGALDTFDTPDPDLIIRSGGEQRLSGFLPWQATYSELYFSDVKWPDFGRRDLDRALAWYAGRKRRFGKSASVLEDPGPTRESAGSASTDVIGVNTSG